MFVGCWRVYPRNRDFDRYTDTTVVSRSVAIMDNKLVPIISDALKGAQEQMPPGQSWNLYSKGACDALAIKIAERLRDESKKDNSLYLQLY